MNYQKYQKMGLIIKENEPMKKHTTFKIGGPAKYFIEVSNKLDLIRALTLAKNSGLPIFVLGAGSNLLVADKGFNGIIIHFCGGQILIQETIVRAFAGVSLPRLVRKTVENQLTGLEFAANIPGTVGGAVYGNAGSYGQVIGDFVKSVSIIKRLDVQTLDKDVQIINLSQSELEFGYRSSNFQKTKDIIIEVEFQLSKSDKPKQQILKAILEEGKKRSQSQPLEYPSAGSIFQNIDFNSLSKDKREELADYCFKEKIPAAKLIEAAGLKGKTIGGAMISKKHANFIINYSHATAADVLALIDLIKNTIKEKFGLELKQEINYLG